MAAPPPPPDDHIWRPKGGRAHHNHAANIIYRCIIRQFWLDYHSAPRGEKWWVVELARASINETTSGLFVKNVRLVNGRLTWDERGDREVFRTIQHALREGNPPAPIDPQVLQGAQSRVGKSLHLSPSQSMTFPFTFPSYPLWHRVSGCTPFSRSLTFAFYCCALLSSMSISYDHPLAAVARERDRAERETYNTNQDIDEVLLQDEDWMDFLADLAQP
mmetsp:Transcript_4741/g.12435  ORF Transcript_4741/g.12435 Transcript_4741/m.12435 type:complete len:218 (+) Transcript_4741:247-900(+)